MNEPLVDKQVRLLLEQECARLFDMIGSVRCDCEFRSMSVLLRNIGFTLIVFDFGAGPLMFSAFKTTLTLKRLCETATWLLERWDRGAPIETLTPSQLGNNKLICLDPLMQIRGFLSAQLPKERGFALIVGAEPWMRYIGTGERSGVAAMIRNEMLPQWLASVRGGAR